MLSKHSSAMGRTWSPTKPMLNSRPATYSCTSTVSHCSTVSASRFLRARLEVTTEPASIPTLASSAAGFTITGRVRSAGILLPSQTAKGGMGVPLRASRVLATCLRWATVTAQGRQPV